MESFVAHVTAVSCCLEQLCNLLVLSFARLNLDCYVFVTYNISEEKLWSV